MNLTEWARSVGGKARRVVVIGLDSAPPDLIFGRFASDMPHVSGLRQSAASGPLQSVVPAITIPAWACAMTGRDPGELGIYGFQHRGDPGYGPSRLVNSTDVKHATVWDVLTRCGEPAIVIGVPPSYPPRRLHGCMVSCFSTPHLQQPTTFPSTLLSRPEYSRLGYVADVDGYRSHDRERLLGDIRSMTKARFGLFRQLLQDQPWTFAMLVEIGLDRMHHIFWDTFDEQHPEYRAGNPFQHVVRDYYRLLDAEIGITLALLGDDTAVFIFSDHGSKAMRGGICINDWLVRAGYLRLRYQPTCGEPLQQELIDYSQTAAWAAGGHVGRIYLNVTGRQPQGVVSADKVREVLNEIQSGLRQMSDDIDCKPAHRMFVPQEIYRECNDHPPDLIVYFGDLDYRAIGTLGHGSLLVADNDTGADAANHDATGMIVAAVPGGSRVELYNSQLIECGPAILGVLGKHTTLTSATAF